MNEIDCKLTEGILVRFIRDCVRKNGFQNGILGVSGGLDSAVALALTQKALGSRHTFALLLPYRLSSPRSLADAKKLCTALGVAWETADISPQVDAYFSRHPSKNRTLIGNKCARERMSILYDFSVRRKALVVGTSNKSELLIGYSTLWGDSAAAFMPLGDLYKTQVFQLARHLGIPAAIVSKVPTADLWQGQTDEGEIGIPYHELDEILCQLVDERKGVAEISAAGIKAATVRKVQKMIAASQYKRTLPPVAKIQPRTVGIDFRYPRDWGK